MFFSKKNLQLTFISFAFTLILGFNWIYFNKYIQPTKDNLSTENLKKFTLNDLTFFDGSDPQKPIYLALDGQVYDVTTGKDYYQIGGSYHDLAGKDSTAQLHLFGGNIIKQKYPVVGILVQ